MSFSREVDVIMPTLGLNGNSTEISLKNLPFKYKLYKNSGANGWPGSINECLIERLKKNKDEKRDVLLIDDDVTLNNRTFNGFDSALPHGDIFGFKLMLPFRRIQHDGGMFTEKLFPIHRVLKNIDYSNFFSKIIHKTLHQIDWGQSNEAGYVAFVTGSLCYIKDECARHLKINNWPGSYWEDVALCVDAWKNNYKVVYYPGKALHLTSRTKNNKKNKDFSWGSEKWRINKNIFYSTYNKEIATIEEYFRPSKGLVNLGKPIQPL